MIRMNPYMIYIVALWMLFSNNPSQNLTKTNPRLALYLTDLQSTITALVPFSLSGVSSQDQKQNISDNKISGHENTQTLRHALESKAYRLSPTLRGGIADLSTFSVYSLGNLRNASIRAP
jgi:hypothetical protein